MKKLKCSYCNADFDKLKVNDPLNALVCPKCDTPIVTEEKISKENVNDIAIYIDENNRESFLAKIGFQKQKKSWAHTGALILFTPLVIFGLLMNFFVINNTLFQSFYYALGPIGMEAVVIRYYLEGKKPKYKKV
jgi:hypothetical protein